MRKSLAPPIVTVVVVLAGSIVWYAFASNKFSGAETKKESLIATTLLDIDAELTDLSDVLSAGRGGAIQSHAKDILGIDKRGVLFRLADDGSVSTVLSNIRTNADAYYAMPEVLDEEANPRSVDRFRVIDIAIRAFDNANEIVVSHNYYDTERRCVSLRVSALRVADVFAVFNKAPTAPDWRVVFDSAPCLTFKWDSPTEGPTYANGHASGGRTLVQKDGSILLTVGDFANDGVNSEANLAQDGDSPYGKIIQLAADGEHYVVISKGHRNPQGLELAADGTLYSTEHGPRGGDELNAIVAGANYGWPLATFGSDYGRRTWPLNERQGRHGVHTPPLFAWLPSVGISNLVEVRDFAPEWEGDFLIATLTDQALWRTRVNDGRVAFTERIPIGSRIRDIVEHKNGIVLWTDTAELIVLTRRSPAGS